MNFVFFLCVIGFGVVISHPAYITAGCTAGSIYYLMLHGKNGVRFLTGMAPLFLLITVLNPIINTSGSHPLFHFLGRPYTLEALFYGMAIGGVFFCMMVWFGCYSVVLTSDKFTSLFGNLIPSLSLLLVMVLRLIPSFTRKAKQISGARAAIGKSVSGDTPKRERLHNGLHILSSLTDWALDGSITTADSMKARGYGTGRRTNFQIYTFTGRDCFLLFLILVLSIVVIVSGGTTATYTPKFYVSYVGIGFAAYCLLLLIPMILQVLEDLKWRRLK